MVTAHVGDYAMLGTDCSFCGHVNLTGSKFCSACGELLTLVLCRHCDALNDKTAIACYKCKAPLPSTRTEELPPRASAAEAARNSGMDVQAMTRRHVAGLRPPSNPGRDLIGSPSAASERPQLGSRIFEVFSPGTRFTFIGSTQQPISAKALFRRHFGIMVGALGLLALIGGGLYAYQYGAFEVLRPPPISGKVTEGTGERSAETGKSTTALPTADPSNDATQASASADRGPSAASDAAYITPTPLPTGNAGQDIEQQRQQERPCTEIVAALGLCIPQFVQRR